MNDRFKSINSHIGKSKNWCIQRQVVEMILKVLGTCWFTSSRIGCPGMNLNLTSRSKRRSLQFLMACFASICLVLFIWLSWVCEVLRVCEHAGVRGGAGLLLAEAYVPGLVREQRLYPEQSDGLGLKAQILIDPIIFKFQRYNVQEGHK